MVPNTDIFEYNSGLNIKGDPNWQNPFFRSGFAIIYDSRQALCHSYSNVAAPTLYVSYTDKGVANDSQGHKINMDAVTAGVEMPLTGGLLAFIPLKSDNLVVLDYDT